MKKITSLLCALFIMLSANAIQPRLNAIAQAMANDFDFVQAVYMEHESSGAYKVGDWLLRVSSGDDLLAIFDINSGFNNKISGTYQIGVPYISHFYDGDKEYNITSGNMSITLVGDTTVDIPGTEYKMRVPVYEFVISNLMITVGQQQAGPFNMFAYSAVFAYDFQYMKDKKDDNFIVLKDDKLDPFHTDTKDQAFNGIFSDTEPNNIVDINTDAFNSDKAVIVYAQNNNRQYLNLVFFVENLDADITIPEGTYPINLTYTPGSMQASQGYMLYEGAYFNSQSCVGIFNMTGDMIDKEWCLTTGEAVVSRLENKLHIVINAKNSHNQTIYAELGANGAALEDVTVENPAAKTIENGQLVIIRNGVRYNAQGAVVE